MKQQCREWHQYENILQRAAAPVTVGGSLTRRPSDHPFDIIVSSKPHALALSLFLTPSRSLPVSFAASSVSE
jgi:hypothetical protein